MPRKTVEPREIQRAENGTGDTPVEKSLLVRQRLRNLCELAIAIGQKNGLLGNQEKKGKGDEDATGKRTS